MSNVSKEIRALKAKATKLLKAGMDSGYIANTLQVSKKLVKEWEDEYVREILADGQGQRVRMRAMLMRMTPQVLMGLHKLATQEIEPRMQLAASQTLVRFGMAFMREDTALTVLEDEARGSTGAKLAEATLFDLPEHISGEQDPIKASEQVLEPTGIGDEDDENAAAVGEEHSGDNHERLMSPLGRHVEDDDIGQDDEVQELLF